MHAQHHYAPPPQQTLNAMNPNTHSSSNTPSSSSASTSNTQDASNTTPGPSTRSSTVLRSKPAYGTGELDDGYTLLFANMEEFQAWRAREEEEKVVEFVKGDTHGSKAVPPRFKDHTKLVCARHTRSGRKKYVKKYPDRQRKLPSRKIDGEGCPASISYKTFFHTDEVRACYNDKHSHEVGEANLMFTRRGRKAAQEKGKLNVLRSVSVASSSGQATTPDLVTTTAAASTTASTLPPATPAGIISSPVQTHDPHAISPSTLQQHLHHSHPNLPPHPTISSSLITPLPSGSAASASQPSDVSQERWDRMAVLFASIRQHARGFEYPTPSVAALESVLIRLYLESPIGSSLGPAITPSLSANR